MKPASSGLAPGSIDHRIAGGDEAARQELRVTMISRRKRGGWRFVLRHADSRISAIAA